MLEIRLRQRLSLLGGWLTGAEPEGSSVVAVLASLALQPDTSVSLTLGVRTLPRGGRGVEGDAEFEVIVFR